MDKNKLENRIKSSFGVWESVLEGKIKFNFVDSFDEDCNIYIDFQRSDSRGAIAQCAFSKILPSGEFRRMYITLGLVYSQMFDTTVIHEIGHALGIMGHSPHNLDIMYATHNPKVASLSQRDINTIRLLYELPLGCNYEYIEKNIKSILNYTYKNEEIDNVIQYPSHQDNIEMETYRDISQETYKIGVINRLKHSQNNIELDSEVCKYLEDIKKQAQI